MGNDKPGWSILWTTEDWLTVWLGFFIIAIVLAGLQVTIPEFKWVTDGEFTSFAAQAVAQADKLAKSAGDKGETGLQSQATALKAALEKADRKGVADAAKKLGAAAKDVKDPGLKKAAGALAKQVGDNAGNTVGKIFTGANIIASIYMAIGILILGIVGMVLMGGRIGPFIPGFFVVFIIAWLSMLVAGNYTVRYFGIEYVLWCLVIGLFISNVIGIPDWLQEAVRTEFYIKVGLVMLGSRILFGEILEAGALGMVQGVLVVGVIWYACFWIAKKFGIDDDFAALLSSGVSICGVSAAIATAGAIKGDPKKLSYVTSLVLICAVPMMVLQPVIAKWVGMPDMVSGAWLGGTLDTSGSVVAAGSLISETAMKVGVIVKMSQNVLIGVAAFILAIVWTFKAAEETGAERPSAMEIWHRFPKFVLGFMASSILFSFILAPDVVKTVKGTINGITVFWFALAFVSIGLETRFADLAKLGGGRPALAFVIAQGINILWTLLLAYLIFGGILFAAPKF